MMPPIVVIGSGPVGIRAVEELSKRDPTLRISLYGGESGLPYDRVRLSSYLAGSDTLEAIGLYPSIPDPSRLVTHFDCPIRQIDPFSKTVSAENGHSERYDKLVLATGSNPYVPSIPNIQLAGVYAFRNLQDAEALKSGSSARTVVLGGGLLGLETARALQQIGAQVTIIDHAINLMNRQLDKTAGDLLMAKVLALGIEVILTDGIASIVGSRHIEGVQLRSGKFLECDRLVLAVGIRPNVELARLAGLKTVRGIVVNPFLQTSNADIYAVGECAEFQGAIYGIVAPGFEQAAIMADHVAGGKKSYSGSVVATRLKVLDYPVFSMGQVAENEPDASHKKHYVSNASADVYRKLVLERQRLTGCIALGDWNELSRIRTAIERQQRIWPWQLRRFVKTGLLWAEKDADSVVYWPDSAIVCNCSQVTRGQLNLCIKQGSSSVCALSASTGAATVCGSCKTLLAELLNSPIEPARAYKTMAVLSVLTLSIVCAYFIAPPVPYQKIATVEGFIDELWRNPLYKQISGYGILASAGLALLLSLRKRAKFLQRFEFSSWRLLHVGFGLSALIMLVLHTGLRLGNNLNFYLMLSFSGLMAPGSLAALVSSLEHTMNPGTARKMRVRFFWLHLLLFWPVPVLLGFHILQTYYF